MKFDRNTVIGFALLGVLFIGYFYWNNKEQMASRKVAQEKARVEDSIRNVQKKIQDSIDMVKNPNRDSVRRANDSIAALVKMGSFAAVDTIDKEAVLETPLMRVTFTSRGGRIKQVELKNYQGQDSNWVKMGALNYNGFSYKIKTGDKGGVEETGNLNFSKIETDTTGGVKRIVLTLQSTDSNAVMLSHEYRLKPNDYMIDMDVKTNASDKLFDQGSMNLVWKYAAAQQESDISYERQQTQMAYVEDGSFDFYNMGKARKEFDEPVKWVGMRQRFFFAAIIAKNSFTGGEMEWITPPDSTKTVVTSVAKMKMPVLAGTQAPAASFSIYYGPADYHILRNYDVKMQKTINLGQGIYSFVNPINRFLIMPVFDFLKGIAGSMGLAIALLTLFIKLITSPLLYKSYLSGAKMKVLRPEIAKLKEKHGADQQAMSMEQMKLFREAGVNPLGGCLPALLQIPVFFALFSLFNSDIALRGADFLWSSDLAAFDDPIKLGFRIPFFGSHISIFNLTAVLTSFLISWYSMSMSPDQSNPILKYMPYIFPVFLLFFFNQLPSALTWYYTVSNLITLGLQYVIQNYIIDHDKIMAKIEANRKKPKTKSKWQQRLEEMQEQQKKMKESQQRNKR